MTEIIVPSLQDYSLIKTHVDKITSEMGLDNPSFGFYFFALEHILNLQDDEAEDAITDNAFLSNIGSRGGHDRGIDAVLIDTSEIPATIHLFNFKYRKDFKKIKSHFPSGEIDKICGFISALMQQDECLQDTVNEVLFQKATDIWDLFDNQNPYFVIHICSNIYNGFESKERHRFEIEIGKYSKLNVEYHLMSDFVNRLTRRGKRTVDARIRAIDTNLFEKSDGDIRALVVDVDVRDLLRIVIENDDARNNVDLDDYKIIADSDIFEDAFQDNVRVYLRQRSKINRNIKETALSGESYRFFYFNNGITVTCSSFSYPKHRRSPIIELKNLQIVNGGQTIHALHEAFRQKPESFQAMDILCRIYETQREKLSTDIAEYTNSQNPVKSRDIRSNDFAQKKLESELSALGYFYERKRNQYPNQPKLKRIDAEKAGQALMAFFNKMPAEAKNKKALIFADKYDEVFSDDITGDCVLVAYKLYSFIEERKLERKSEILNDPRTYEDESFILHATYYILYVMSELADLKGLSKTPENIPELIALYDKAVSLIQKAIKEEKHRLDGYAEKYSHRLFFTSIRPKKYLETIIK